MYLDCDTTPPLRSTYSSRSVERAVEVAKRKLARVTEGQIGVYENHLGCGFKGYVIKYPGEAPYFEGLH